MTFITSLRKELMEQARTARWLIALVVLAFFGITSPLLAKFTPELLKLIPSTGNIGLVIPPPTILDAIGQYIKNIAQFGFLLALLLTMGMVAVEKERGTAALMLVKPLPRSTFILTKFLALALTLLSAVTIAGLGAYYYTYALFSAPDLGGWLAMNALLWLYMLAWVAITLFFSILVKSQAAAAGLSFGLLIVLSLIGAIPALAVYLPDQLIGWGASLAAQQGTASAWPALWTSLGLILAALIGGWLIFRKQEL